MRIGFDVSQTAENKAGCGFFADQLIHALAAMDHTNEYLLYPTFYGYRHPNFAQATFPDQSNIRMLLRDSSLEELHAWWNESRVDRTTRLGSPNIVHSNNFSLPSDIRARKVMTMYDLAFLDLPDLTTEENRIVCFKGVFEASIYCDGLIMISEATKQIFQKYFPHYPEERITVVPLGTRPTVYKQDKQNCSRILSRMRVKSEGFWLGVGTVEPRKNYRALIQAYSQLVEKGEEKPLYIAGGNGWLESDIGRYVTEKGLSEKVKFLGYVTDEQLSALYSSCFAFIYPSLYEGFGLPLVEAMSCGAPVITSNTTSMPEVAGDAGLLIDPYSVHSIVSGMERLNESAALRNEMMVKSVKRAALFNWHNAAKKTLSAYEKALSMKSYCDR